MLSRGEGEKEVEVKPEDCAAVREIPAERGSEVDAPQNENCATELPHVFKAQTAESDVVSSQLLRLRADFDNYRKRTTREFERIRKIAAESLVRDLLPVLDNLEHALRHADDASSGLKRGVEMVFTQLKDALARTGLETIPALGEPFNPNVHEAISCVPSEEYPADTVMEEFSPGYRIGDYIVRPAKVVVSSGPAENATVDASFAVVDDDQK